MTIASENSDQQRWTPEWARMQAQQFRMELVIYTLAALVVPAAVAALIHFLGPIVEFGVTMQILDQAIGLSA